MLFIIMYIYTHVQFVAICNCDVLHIYFRNKRFGRGTEEDSHEALRCVLSALRQEEIKVCYHYQYSYTYD